MSPGVHSLGTGTQSEAMKTILVTGASGFMGRNLIVALKRRPGLRVLEFDVQTAPATLPELVARADLVFHLAGVNRPQNEGEFTEGNVDLTRRLVEELASGSRAPLVFSSSIQAEQDNPYGASKLAAEKVVRDYQRQTGTPVRIYRFPNVFGKWSRPHYNTVVATFCHQISRGLPVQITNPDHTIRFVYIDDIVREFIRLSEESAWQSTEGVAEVAPVYPIRLGQLHELIQSFRESRERRLLPDLSRPLVKYLYSTYLSFCDPQGLATPVELKQDDRGWLFEWVKSPSAGQIFVSTTRPGITRGNHYHDTKVEKFCVVQGRGVIRLRPLLGGPLVEYAVDSHRILVVDIPPGYAHSIENTGSTDMVTLFWANEIFDPACPDTYAEAVLQVDAADPEATTS